MQFLSLEGLKLVVSNIKTLIANASAASKITNFSATQTASNATISLKQGTDTFVDSVTIGSASTSTAGLLSAADKSKLDGIAAGAQVNVIEGIVVRAEGDTDTAINMTTFVDGKKLVIDNLGTIATAEPTDATAKAKDAKLAPTAKAVRDYVTGVKNSLSTNVDDLTDRMEAAESDIDKLQTDLLAEVTRSTNKDNALQAAIDGINNASTGILATAKSYTDTEVGKEKTAREAADTALQGAIDAINNASTGILAKAQTYADGKVSDEATARDNADKAIIADLDKVEAFLGTLSDNNTKAANVYTKAEVTTAIEEAKKAILTGESTEQLGTAYDTLIEISKWISTHGTEATNLASAVAQNAEDIEELQAKDTQILNTLGTGFGTGEGQTVADKISSLQSTLLKAVEDEETRAKAAEAKLTTDLAAEVTRAKAAESTLATDLAAEVTRATEAEEALQDNIDTLSDTVTANKNAIEKTVSELAYVNNIASPAVADDSGVITLNYSVNNGTATPTSKSVNLGSIIQETDITALFA